MSTTLDHRESLSLLQDEVSVCTSFFNRITQIDYCRKENFCLGDEYRINETDPNAVVGSKFFDGVDLSNDV